MIVSLGCGSMSFPNMFGGWTDKVDEKPDDEKFLEKMKEAEMTMISEREKRVSEEVENVFDSIGSNFFKSSSHDETIFNPASCLRVKWDKQWVTTRRNVLSDDEKEEEVMKAKDSDEEVSDKETEPGDDIEDDFLNIFNNMDTEEDSEDPEEKKTLKRKNEDEEECKEAKRRYGDQ